MIRTMRRRAALLGGLLAVACAAAAPTAGATSAADVRGTWIQSSWKIDGRALPCPVKLDLPAPAPAISCAADTRLVLKKNGRYSSNMPVFRSNDADEGFYAVSEFDGGKRDVIVFDDDGAQDTPRAYRVQVKRSASGKQTLRIFLAMSSPDGSTMRITMIFGRKAG